MIYVFRHGRTFEDGEQSYDLAPNDDPPLTEFGLEQAKIAGHYCDSFGYPVVCGPQQRHRKFAKQIKSEIIFDEKLNEGGELFIRPNSIMVTSNGVLKKFHGHVNCGNLCILDNNGEIHAWNIKP